MLELISIAVSYLLVTSGNLIAFAIIADALMHRRHSYKFFFVYNTLRVVICNIPFIVFLDEVMKQHVGLRAFYFLLVVVCAILSYGVFLYTFQDSFVRIAIICAVVDMFVSFLGCNIQIILHMITGYSAGGLGSPFTPIDLLVPVLTALIASLLVKLLASFFTKIRHWQVRQERIVMGVFFIYQVMGILSMHREMADSFSGMVYVCLFASIWLFVSYIYYFHKKTKMENEALRKQHEIARLQYEAVTLQIEQIEQLQREIQNHMKEILAISESAEKTKEIEDYIAKLRRQSETITTGVYCDDWYLDFVLCHIKKNGKEKEIRTDFYLQGYHTSNDSENIASCLLALWKTLTDKEMNMFSLRITTVKGNIIMKVTCDSKHKINDKKLFKILRESGATLDQNILDNHLYVDIVIYKSGH